MYKFSENSRIQLESCHPELQRLFGQVINYRDCTILEGNRTTEQQRKNIERGVSKTMRSKHLHVPSLAVDVAPYPLTWPKKPVNSGAAERTRWMKEYGSFYLFSGFVLGIAQSMNIKIRWGGDWDGDWEISDQSFDDLVHFELVE